MQLVRLARECGVPCVATNAVVYAAKDDALLADVLACVRDGHDARTRARRQRACVPMRSTTSKRRLRCAGSSREYPEALDARLAIAQRCRFRLERLAGQFPLFPVPDGELAADAICASSSTQARRERYPVPLETRRRAAARVRARHHRADGSRRLFLDRLGYRAGGRASSACSAKDAARPRTRRSVTRSASPRSIRSAMNLLFERFMSEERREIPDIDIDFAHQDREQVIQYVYERYGRANAAMVAEVITYRTRSAIRDVGKALGLPLEQVDAIAREFDARESLPDDARAGACSSSSAGGSRLSAPPGDPFGRHADHARSAGARRAGRVGDDARSHRRAVGQGRSCKILGLIKIDLLGLGMLSLLREALRSTGDASPRRSLAAGSGPRDLALHTIPADDEPTYAMMQRADTVGVFQIESRAQQSMLPRMKPACFYDIVMQVAIIRPGPIQGRDGPSVFAPARGARSGDLSASQAQAGPGAHARRAALSRAGDADGDRGGRLLAGRGRPAAARDGAQALARAHARRSTRGSIDGMVANGIDRAAAEQLFHMLEGFADYGFPESHAASFALLGLRLGVPQMPPSGGLCCRDPQRAADGILLDRSAGQRRAPARRDDCATASESPGRWCPRSWASFCRRPTTRPASARASR